MGCRHCLELEQLQRSLRPKPQFPRRCGVAKYRNRHRDFRERRWERGDDHQLRRHGSRGRRQDRRDHFRSARCRSDYSEYPWHGLSDRRRTITLSQPNTVITVNNVSSQNLINIPDAEISSQLTGNSNVSITGAGTLTIGNITAGAANNYVGITTISTSVSVGNVNSSNVRSATTVATPFGALNNSVVLSGGNITNNATGGTQAFQYAFTITANTNNIIFGSKVSQTSIGDTTSVPGNPFGSVGGSGTLTFNAGGGGTSNIKANFSTFSGTFNLVGGGNVRAYTNGGAFTGSVGMAFDIESSPSVITTLSPQTNSGAGNTYNLGSLTSVTANPILNGGTSGTATYSVGALGTNTTYAGVIGAGATLNAALTKVGGGSLTLTNNLAYTGATTVTGGTLLVDGTISASTATVGVSGTLGGVGTFTQMVNDNGTINPAQRGPVVLDN